MTSFTYLVNDLIESCENESQEFLDYTPKMIYKAEERLFREIDDYGLVVYTSVAVSASNPQVSLPAGTRVVKNLNITDDSGIKTNILLRTDEFLTDYWPNATSTGTPKYYAKLDHTAIRLAPTPVSTVSGELVYEGKPETLTSANQTNYFTDNTYDALYYAAMIEALLFEKNWSAVPMYEGRFKDAVNSLRNQARRTRRDDLQPNMSPAGGDNTITGGN